MEGEIYLKDKLKSNFTLKVEKKYQKAEQSIILRFEEDTKEPIFFL